MDLGATICAPRSVSCMICPLQPECRGTRTTDPLAFPVRTAKVPRPNRYGHAFVICDLTGEVYLRTRAATGLLAKMTEVPVSPWIAERTDPPFPVPQADWRFRGEVTHTFTHFRLTLEVWSATTSRNATPLGGWWAKPDRLDAEALPSLFRKVLVQAGFDTPRE
jgi:A/G-specific adenine glycosylase